ncbi:hypothetical protein [Curtobacterium sp. P97]|uniref:hypothetical protein n=1 Tax=Curtobacterium sp. P97 TaxID=2939562 RepID=UPI00203E8B8E|nr:hypothetical protein [Curtobacterium sp. P97]MCM3521798.1 hypothetical protein [Curtobacterium sp. P97]
MDDNTPIPPRKKAVVLRGHAFRPVKNPIAPRGVIPWCECGEQLLLWPIDSKTARHIHDRHKASIMRATEQAGTDA